MSRGRPRVLVVYKKDAYQHYVLDHPDGHLVRLLRRAHPELLEQRRAHAVHQETLRVILQVLHQLPVDVDVAHRAALRVRGRYDLLVSVGGDGTFLQTAHSAHRAPILGVNSDPTRSEAVFCAATRQSFRRLCRQALDGRLPVLRLHWLRLSLNGRALPHRVLNEILVSHPDPATMNRYRLRVGTREELQKSSGLWVATAAGSTSAVHAAGGIRLPWAAAKFQYRPRELYDGRLSRCRLRGGVLGRGDRLQVTWLMRRGSVFVDGARAKVELRFADRLEARLSTRDPLRVLGLRRP